jgi:hypothetical protein
MRLDRARLSPAARRSLEAAEAAEAAPKGGPPRPSPLSPWEVFAASVRANLQPASEGKSVWLEIPGLQLLSENVALRGGNGKSRIAVACEAKRQAQDALMGLDEHKRALFARFQGPCEIIILQSCEKHPRIDVTNLFHKALVDCFTARSGGIGIIEDDSPEHVHGINVRYCSNWVYPKSVQVVFQPPTWPVMEIGIVERIRAENETLRRQNAALLAELNQLRKALSNGSVH